MVSKSVSNDLLANQLQGKDAKSSNKESAKFSDHLEQVQIEEKKAKKSQNQAEFTRQMKAAQNCKEASLANELKLTELRNELRVKQVDVDFAQRKQFKLNFVNVVLFICLIAFYYQTKQMQDSSPNVPQISEEDMKPVEEEEEPEVIKIINVTIPE